MKRMTVFCAALVLVAAAAMAAMSSYKLTYGPANTLVTITQVNADKWTAQEAGVTYEVEVKDGVNVTFSQGGSLVASGKLEEGKLKLKTPDGSFYFKVKFKEDKTKVYLSDEDEEGYSIKIKEDKYKIKRGETELGKIKFYPDNGKLKVKDVNDAELAVSKDMGRLTAAPAGFAIPDLDGPRRYFLLLYLLAMNK